MGGGFSSAPRWTELRNQPRAAQRRQLTTTQASLPRDFIRGLNSHPQRADDLAAAHANLRHAQRAARTAPFSG
jgi:hypothetical protein